MPTTTDLLDLRGIGQRASAYRFDLLDRDETVIGELHPDRDATPTITHDTSRFIQRDIASFNLTPPERLDVDTLSNRVKPYLVMEDGSEWPLGVFLFADPSRPRLSYGSPLNTTLLDKGFIIDQPSEHSVGIPAAADVRTEIIRVLSMFNLTSSVENTGTLTGHDTAWPAGTSWAGILSDLCLVGGYFAPYFDHLGVCRVRARIDPDTTDPDVTYGPGANIYAGTPVESDDLFRAPNRFVVIGSDAGAAPVVGVYDLPAGAPQSFSSRGFRVTEVIQQQGLASSAAAVMAAQVYAESRSVFENAVFSGPPDPRHDANTVVEYLGERWLEVGWTLVMAAVGPMGHTLRKVYT